MGRALEAAGAAGGAGYRLFCRRGRVLCGLPADREVALKTLGLYQPQRVPARVVAALAEVSVKVGWAAGWLPEWRTPGSFRGAEVVGVLVGSEGHLCERAVTVKRGPAGWEVTKHGFGPAAAGILGSEARMLEQLAGRTFVPALLGFGSGPEGAALSMVWRGGAPWRDEDPGRIPELLDGWREPGAMRALEDFAEWPVMIEGTRGLPGAAARLETLAALQVACAVRHGDLTRPNLRVDRDGALVVHDWERGAMSGVAGLDLAHYLTQDLAFRRRLGDARLAAEVHEALCHPKAAAHLDRAGWRGNESGLMLATWAFNTGAGYLDQRGLIAAVAG